MDHFYHPTHRHRSVVLDEAERNTVSLRVQEQYPDVREPGAFGQASEHIRPIACVLAHTPRGTCPIVERLRVSPHASRVLSSRAIAGGELKNCCAS